MDWFTGRNLVLQNAIDADDPAAVEAAIRAGAQVNAKGVHGVTPLEYAIGHFRKQAYQELLKLKADTAQRDDEKDNAMTLAVQAYAKDPDYLKLALEAGGDPNTRRPDNDPIIVRFINDRNLEAIRLMKKAGADLNIRNRADRPLVIYAGIIEYWDVVWCFLELGADYQYPNEPIGWKEIFNRPKVTPPDSPLRPYKVKAWKFLRERGIALPDLTQAE